MVWLIEKLLSEGFLSLIFPGTTSGIIFQDYTWQAKYLFVNEWILIHNVLKSSFNGGLRSIIKSKETTSTTAYSMLPSKYLPNKAFISPQYPRLPGRPELPMAPYIYILKIKMISLFSFLIIKQSRFLKVSEKRLTRPTTALTSLEIWYAVILKNFRTTGTWRFYTRLKLIRTAVLLKSR